MAHVGWRTKSVWDSGRRFDFARALSGHALPTARELIGLIHDVNPTGRELDKPEEARRYALKTRLQSLLVERFSEDLEVVPDAREGIVLLRHKYLGLAASHAVVADLDEAARAWVQRQLDRDVVEQAWTKAPCELERSQREPGRARRKRGHRGPVRARRGDHRAAGDGTAEMLAALEQGRAAQASYDYVGARAAFERACAWAPNAPVPLAALLDLMVNQLGLDAEALQVAEAANGVALASATARAALALSAARLGERERAEAWAEDLDGARAAEVFRALAAKAIAANDLSYAALALERARQHLASDPERILLQANLDRVRAKAVIEDEARLAQLVAAGEAMPAAALARQIVERHPGSAPAHAVLKEAAARERRLRRQRYFDEARAAVLQAHFKQARQALASARECGASAQELADGDRMISAAEAKASRREQEKLRESVVAHLSGTPPERKSAMAIYLGLDRRDRAEVRERCSAMELAWLDEIPPGESRGASIAAAVVAARAAAALLEERNLDAAEQMLAAHRPVLGDHDFGRQLLGRLDGARQQSQQVRALAALEKASEALRARDFVALKNMLESIPRDRLPSSSLAQLDRLSQALASQRQHRVCLALVEQRLAKQLPIAARQLLLDRLSESRDDDERASLLGRLTEVDGAIRRVHVAIDSMVPPGYAAGEAPEMVINYAFDRDVDTILLPGGRTAVLLSAGQTQVAARLVDVDSGQVQRVLAWGMMEAYLPVSMGLGDGHLWIADSLFHYAEIACESWLPCRQRNLASLTRLAEDVTGAVAFPGEDTVWLKTRQMARPCADRLRLFETARGSMVCSPDLDDEGEVYRIPGTAPSLLAWFHPGVAVVTLCSARGEAKVYIAIPGVPLGVAVAPAGDGYVVLYKSKDEADRTLGLVVTDATGCERSHLCLSVAHKGPAGVATILPRRLVCVSYRTAESGHPRLAYVREAKDGGLVLAADVEIAGLTGIAQDPAASTAVALCRTARGVRLTRLDEMPSAFPAVHDEFKIPRLFKFVNCSPPAEPDLETRITSDARLFSGGEADPALTDENLEKLAASLGESISAASTHRALRFRGIHGRADRLLELMEKQGSDDFFVRLALTERDALAGRWSGGSLESAAAAAGASEHLLHVRAVAELRAGRLDDVIETLTGRARPGECRLDGVLTVARALRAEREGEPIREEKMSRPCLTSLVRSIFAADRALARGDHGEVPRILDQAWIRQAGEAQSYARLAEVYLGTRKDAAPLQWFKASTFLVDFVGAHFAIARHNNLWLGPSTWPLDRVDALEEKATNLLLTLAWKPEAVTSEAASDANSPAARPA
jgi:hypothetical protein